MSNFAYPVKGPFGKCLQNQLQMTFDENIAFSDAAWENAKQTSQYGCVLPPGIPQWPASQAVTIPSASTDAQLINTLQAKPFQFNSPFVRKREYQHLVDPNQLVAAGTSSPPASSPSSSSSSSSSSSPSSSVFKPSSPDILSVSWKSLLESVKGVHYDAKHWAQLPGDSVGAKLQFMATHDSDRVVILVLGSLVVLSLIVLIVLVSLVGGCD